MSPLDPSLLKGIRCLSIRAPWCSLIMAGIMPVERRQPVTAYRGPIILHSAESRASLTDQSRIWLDERVDLLEELGRRDEAMRLAKWLDEYWPSWQLVRHWKGDPLGHVLGIALLTDCRDAKGPIDPGLAPWYPESGCAWHLESARRLTQPIPCNGKLDLWKPEEDILRAVAPLIEPEMGAPGFSGAMQA